MSDKSAVKPEDIHATSEPAEAEVADGEVTTLGDIHATDEPTKTEDIHATSEPTK
ncbi:MULTISPECIES: hypothetical protein [Streptomyces]|uniref:Uncharacterized protein n=1 Tax=Streptomyces griseorubiginosus TaxID=67304 RepID=A0AAI8L2Q0_9ACTN|nr:MULTISPECIES: hypothetical protein [Streptomyces]AYC40530.1 hypothetical protein DWG14_04795 [Streptomyces griseorubiginosus]TCR21138.1 hypothetical protein EV578_106278 [Streptomyces sp. BK205]